MAKLFDIQATIAAANGNVTLAKDLFSMLLNELETRLKQIETSYNTQDLQALAQHAHKLFGSTAYCIVPELRSSSDKLENALINKDVDQLEDLVSQVKTDIQNLINEGPRFLDLNWEIDWEKSQ